MKWAIRKKMSIGAAVCTPQATKPRNSAADPAFAMDFNLPLPGQYSPGTTGITMSVRPPVDVDVPSTPDNDRLKELAANNPPPPQWFDGEEEKLF